MNHELIKAMNTVYDKSKFWLGFNLTTAFLTAALAITATFFNEVSSSFGFVFFGVALQLAAVGSRYRSDSLYDLGEEIRIALTQLDGLGHSIPQLSWLIIREKVGNFQNLPAAPTLGNYYDSKEPPGPGRLIEIIQESAFWTSTLTRKASLAYFILSVAGIALTFAVIVYAATALNDIELIRRVGIAVPTAFTFWATSDLFALALGYHKLHKSTGKISEQASALSALPSIDPTEALLLFSDYNRALACGPVIPRWIFSIKQLEIHSLWASRNHP